MNIVKVIYILYFTFLVHSGSAQTTGSSQPIASWICKTWSQLPLGRQLFDKMENINRLNANLSGNLLSTSSESLFNSFRSTEYELNELTSSFAGLTIDLKGMVRELFEHNKRDTASIRQDFIRNGIDSGVVTQVHNTRRQPPPGSGASRWPLASLENQLPKDKRCASVEKVNMQGITSDRNGIKTTRRKRSSKEHEDYCVFCYNNREEQETYLGHSCRDEDGFVLCPKLRMYVCPYCQATGDTAHTKKYCPKKPIITPDDLQKMASPFVCNNASRRSRNNGKRSLRF